MSRPEYLQIRTDQIRPQLDIICKRMGLDPTQRGAYAEAVQFAVQHTAYDPPRPRRLNDLEKLAADLYAAAYPDVDDKRFHANKETEILDWLKNGDIYPDRRFDSILAEWQQYDAQDDAE